MDIIIQRKVYLGNIVGRKILSIYTKIAVSFENNTLNNILAASIESAYLTSANGRFISVPLYTKELDYAVKNLIKFSPQSLTIIIGGDNEKYTEELFKQFTHLLHSNDFHSDILIDGINFTEDRIRKLVKDHIIYKLFEQNNSYLYAIDPQNGIVILKNIVTFGDNGIDFYMINEFPITFDHGKLLET